MKLNQEIKHVIENKYNLQLIEIIKVKYSNNTCILEGNKNTTTHDKIVFINNHLQKHI